MPEKSKINFIVDACMFVCMMPLAGIGFLMKFVLIPGKDRMAVYGSNVDLFFLGLDRHEWGTIHLWIAFILLALLTAHIMLHLRWISALLGKLIVDRKKQVIAAVTFIVLCFFLLVFPLLIKPEVRDAGQGFQHDQHTGKGAGRGLLKEKRGW